MASFCGVQLVQLDLVKYISKSLSLTKKKKKELFSTVGCYYLPLSKNSVIFVAQQYWQKLPLTSNSLIHLSITSQTPFHAKGTIRLKNTWTQSYGKVRNGIYQNTDFNYVVIHFFFFLMCCLNTTLFNIYLKEIKMHIKIWQKSHKTELYLIFSCVLISYSHLNTWAELKQFISRGLL